MCNTMDLNTSRVVWCDQYFDWVYSSTLVTSHNMISRPWPDPMSVGVSFFKEIVTFARETFMPMFSMQFIVVWPFSKQWYQILQRWLTLLTFINAKTEFYSIHRIHGSMQKVTMYSSEILSSDITSTANDQSSHATIIQHWWYVDDTLTSIGPST